MLAADVPDLEVHVWQGDGGDILSYCRHGAEFWRRVAGQKDGFHLFVKSGFAGVVETEEQDGVLCERGLLVRGVGSNWGC